MDQENKENKENKENDVSIKNFYHMSLFLITFTFSG